MLTIKESIENIDVVISNVKMTRLEHEALQQSLTIVVSHIKDLEEKLEEKKNG